MSTAYPGLAKGRAVRSEAADRRAAQRIEDIEFLLQWDNNAESVARRAGFTCAASAERYLARRGRHDLTAKLHRYAENCDPYTDQWGYTAFGVAS